tara:strand:- start:608 stop:2080 length:1473 start_codon:yes stop_codon:yes gene_type:complete
MGLFATGGSYPAGLTPSPTKTLFAGNYLTFDAASGGGTFAQQFLPDVYEKEVERYGNRSVASFLRMVGAEIPSASDQIIWSEQGRLHIAYSGASANTSTGVITQNGHAIRVGQTVAVIEAGNHPNDGVTWTADKVVKGVVSAVAANTFTVLAYGGATLTAAGLTSGSSVTVKVFVYGSEFAKGSAGMAGSIDAGFQKFSNSPIIIKDKYNISGSDTAQIGWVEVTSENGASGYLWYLKSEHETRLRFEDYLEMGLVEGELAAGSSGAEGGSYKGTEGLFAAISSRGNVYQNFNSGENALDNSDGAARSALGDFDEILKNLDKQGAIEENMMFLNRATALAIDDMLAAQNSYGAGGTSYGVFQNSEDMALTLGFSGFRRGSYDFYKTDWKYLNDATTRGLGGNIDGVLVPAGTSTVYDQQLGKNIKRPFLHVRYRASEADDRKMKSWITGSVGGVYTSDVDEMNVHFLSERCLCVQGANNFVLFKTAAQVA